MDHHLRTRLSAGDPIILDGGLATTLEADGFELPGPLWSARALLDGADRVRDAHVAFLDAGAEVVLTASYQLSSLGLRSAGEHPGQTEELFAHSVRLAREATSRARSPALVAGSLGPYGAALADGSEYTGRYDITRAGLRDFHGPRIAALVAAGVDILALETLPGGLEVTVVAELVEEAGLPAWVSTTLAGDGTRTPRGEPLAEALAPAAAADAVFAVGVNCCPPRLVAAALESLAGLSIPLVAKPNAGARWNPVHQRWDRRETPVDPTAWVRAGARLIGGCCGTSPGDLASLAAEMHR